MEPKRTPPVLTSSVCAIASNDFPELSFPLILTGRTAFVRFPRRCSIVSFCSRLVCRVLLKKGMARTGRSGHRGNLLLGTKDSEVSQAQRHLGHPRTACQ